MQQSAIGIGLPEKMEMNYDEKGLVIVRRWFGAITIFLTVFVIFWDGFLVYWYTHVPADAPSMALWFPMLHVAVGLFLTYRALAGWLNRTYVRVGYGTVSVKTVPLPFFHNRSLAAAEIKQLYSKKRIRTNKGRKSETFEVRAVTQQGKNVKLVGGLDSSEQALFLEEAIEKNLGIKDAPVKREL